MKNYYKKIKYACAALALTFTLAASSTDTEYVYAEETAGTEAVVEIKNDETGIPDVNIYKAVLKECDSNGDGILTAAEAQNMRVLELRTEESVNFQGVEKLTNVYRIKVWYAADLENVESIKNLSLQTLYLSEVNVENEDLDIIGQITTIDSLTIASDTEENLDVKKLSSLGNITSLILKGNWNIKENPDVIKGFALKTLEFHGCEITNEVLECIGQISTIKNLAISSNKSEEILDLGKIQNLTKLSSLSLKDTKMTNLQNVKDLPITYLVIQGAGLTDEDLKVIAQITTIERLDLQKNNLSNISSLADMQIEKLYLQDNQLTNIDDIKNMPLEYLDVSNNRLTNLDAIKGLLLEYIAANNNLITDVSVFEGSLITEMYLSGNRITDISPFANIAESSFDMSDEDVWLDLSNNFISDLSAFKDSQFVKNFGDMTTLALAYYDEKNELTWRINLCGNFVDEEEARENFSEAILEAWVTEYDPEEGVWNWISPRIGWIDLLETNGFADEEIQKMTAKEARENGVIMRWLEYHPFENLSVSEVKDIGLFHKWFALHKDDITKLSVVEFKEACSMPERVSIEDETAYEECVKLWQEYWESKVTDNAIKVTTIGEVKDTIDNLSEGITAVCIQSRGEVIEKVTSDIFKAAAQKNISVIVDCEEYVWTFSDISDDVDTELAVQVNVDADVEEIDTVLSTANVNLEDVLTVSFAHNGKLPAPAIISLNVGTRYQEGSKLYFYYFDPAAKTFRYITESVVQDGKLEVEINHCSDYIFTKEPLAETLLWDDSETRGFVERLYTLVLEREADQTGIDSWTNVLLNKESNGVDIGYGFVFSPECIDRNLSDDAFVEMLYNTFMNRPSDEGGKSAWVTQLANGVSREKVLEGFIMSQEFLGICAEYGIEAGTVSSVAAFEEALNQYRNQNADVTAFVARCYTQALSRGFDEEGLNAWCRVILTQENTPTDVAKNFIFSDEFIEKGLDDTEYLKVLYRTFMGREADEAGLNGWLAVLKSGEEDREKVLEGFANSLEFAEILASFGLGE